MANQTGGIRSYGPGKFDTVLDSHFWAMSLDGPDEEVGDSSIGVYYCLLHSPFEVTALDLTPAEVELVKSSVGVIMSEDGQGFVHAEYFDNQAALDKAWRECMDEVERFEAADEENG